MSYLTEFNEKQHLKDFYSGFEGNSEEKGFMLFHRKQVIQFYKNYSSKWDNNTARLLEFGGGAIIAGLISAVPYVSEIIFSAHTEGERKEVELWKFEKRWSTRLEWSFQVFS